MQIKRSLLRNISVGRLQVGAVFIFSGKLKCCITKIQILGPEAFLGTRKSSKSIPRDLPGAPKWPKWSPRGPPKTPTITLRTLQGPPRGQLDAPRPSKSLSGAILGSPGTMRNLQNPYVSLRKTLIFQFGPNAVRTRPQTRSLTPKRGPTGPKVGEWRQGTPPGGKTF